MRHCFTLSLLLSLTAACTAQHAHLDRCLSAASKSVTAYVDTVSGQLGVTAADGTPILFVGDGAFTSYATVNLDGVMHTNNNVLSTQPPLNGIPFPKVAAWQTPDSVGYSVLIEREGRKLLLSQTFIPLEEAEYGFVRVVTVLHNQSAQSISAGLQMMYDLCIGNSDNVDVDVTIIGLGDRRVVSETGWKGNGVPLQFTGTAAGHPYKVMGRLRHDQDSLAPPDRLVIGRWSYNGYLGAASWDYEANGQAFWDNAALLQWDVKTLAPGERRVIITDYGLALNPMLPIGIVCAPDTIKLRRDRSPGERHIFSTGASVSYDSTDGPVAVIEAEIVTTEGLFLAAGEQALKRFTLTPGERRMFSWSLEADTSAAPAKRSLRIIIRNFGAEIGECIKTVMIPGLPMELICLPVVIAADTAEGVLRPNPVTITATLRNASPVPVSGVECVLLVPPVLTIKSPVTTVINPYDLDSGQQGSASWLVELPERVSAAQYPFTIYCPSDDIYCEGMIDAPAVIPLSKCDEENTTSGREFWVAFPKLHQMIPDSVFIRAITQERTRIRIESGDGLLLADTAAPAWSVIAFKIDGHITWHSPETASNRSVFVSADRDISVMSSIDTRTMSEAATVLPVPMLGKRYMTLAEHGRSLRPLNNDQILLIATEDGTTVTVIPSQLTGTGKAPGVPFTVMLDRGGVLPVMSTDTGWALSGTEIIADKPVAAFAGSEVSNVGPTYTAANPFYEQLPAEEDHGGTYVILPYRSRKAGAMFRVLAREDSTSIDKDGRPWVTLAKRGDAHEDWTEGDPVLLEGDKPFFAAQYSASLGIDQLPGGLGDPSMVYPLPPEAFTPCHVFYAGPESRLIDGISAAPWDSIFVSIVAWSDAADLVRLDGIAPPAEFIDIPGSPFSVAAVNIQSGIHRLTTGDTRGVYGMSYAFANADAYSTITSRAFKRTPPARVEDATPSNRGIDLKVLPNPAQGSSIVEFTLPTESCVRVDCVDLLGRVRLKLKEARLPAGPHRIHFDAASLPTGRYWIRMSTGGITVTRPVHVIGY